VDNKLKEKEAEDESCRLCVSWRKVSSTSADGDSREPDSATECDLNEVGIEATERVSSSASDAANPNASISAEEGERPSRCMGLTSDVKIGLVSSSEGRTGESLLYLREGMVPEGEKSVWILSE
jgi:hypothetical protein